MKRKKIIKHRIEQKTAVRKKARREYQRTTRAKSTTKYNTGQPISPVSPGIPAGRIGEFIKSLSRRRK